MPGTPFSWAGFEIGNNITHSKFQEIVNNLNTERARRGKGAIDAVSAVGNKINASEINYIKAYISDCVATSWPQATGVGDIISYASILQLQTAIDNIRAICLCQCNYACTCQCNYGCTCYCNYGCTCQCNYGCTCNCNYSGHDMAPNYDWNPAQNVHCGCRGHVVIYSCSTHSTAHCPAQNASVCPSHIGFCSAHQG